ncbi:MAG: hypothetical protein QNJ47_17350 [Nostocaceae cyanobacterium]|nr:hypothetical protein [Nostocaceae cyanobacterium]
MVRLLGQKKRTGSVLTTFAIATFGLHVLTLFLLIIQGLNIRNINVRKSPTFVQLINGQPVNVTDDLQREPEAIRQFVSNTMISMFDWSGNLPAANIEQVAEPKIDPGISITIPKKGGKKVTTSSWIASFALSEDFRKGFLTTIAEMTPPEIFSLNSKQAMTAQLRIKRVYPPEKIAPGEWRVGMVADLIQKKRSDDRKVITPFNKDFLVRAVDTFPYPLPEKMTDQQKAIYNMRAERLEIFEMRNLCLLDKSGENYQSQINPCNPGSSGSFIR